MKTDWSSIEQFRQQKHMPSPAGAHFGVFYLRVGSTDIIAIASNESPEVPWEHVSLRARDYKGERTPTWAEMCHAKDLFWDDTECVIQFHPPKCDYVNHHKYVLHLWKPVGQEISRPPKIAV